jgi:PAS domain S-box-containing protein
MDMGKMDMNKEIAKRELDKDLIYNRVFENPIVGMTILDMNQNVIFGNSTARKIFQLERDPVGVNVREFLNKESKNLVDTIILPALEKTGIWQGELVGKLKDGREVPLSASCAVIYDEEGRSHAIHATYRDITGRKQMEEALRESAEKYRGIFTGTHDAIWIVKVKEGEFIYEDVNPEYSNFAGVDKRDVVGKRLDEIFEQETANKISRDYGWVVKEKKTLKKEQHLKFPIGEKWHLTTLAPLLDENGDVDRIIGSGKDITELKRAEGALRESEIRYRRLVDTAPDVIYTISWDGTLTSLNPAFEKITGWPCSEWLNKPFAELVHPDDLAKAVETFQQTMRGETPPPYELRIRTKSGDYLVGEFISKPLIEKGEVIGELGIARDITERKRAEEALRESEKRYRSLVETSPDAVTMTDLEGRIIYVSPQTLELHGFKSAEELSGRSAFDLIAPEDHERAMTNLQKTMKEGIVRKLEYVFLKKDGTHFIGELSVALIKDAYGKPKAFIATTMDITERKQVENKLRESEKRYYTLFENANDAVFITDTETGKLLYVNKMAEILTGKSRDELIGMHQSMLHPPEDAKHYKEAFRNHVRNPSVNVEAIVMRKDGTRIPVLISASTFELGGKKVIQGIFRDVTELKKAEDKLRIFRKIGRKS